MRIDWSFKGKGGLIKAMGFSFVTEPQIGFRIGTRQINLTELPAINVSCEITYLYIQITPNFIHKDMVNKVVKQSIKSFMLHPNVYVYDFTVGNKDQAPRGPDAVVPPSVTVQHPQPTSGNDASNTVQHSSKDLGDQTNSSSGSKHNTSSDLRKVNAKEGKAEEPSSVKAPSTQATHPKAPTGKNKKSNRSSPEVDMFDAFVVVTPPGTIAFLTR